MPVIVNFKLLPSKKAQITEEWVSSNHGKLCEIPRLRIYRNGNDTEGLVKEVRKMHGDIVQTLEGCLHEFLSSENRKPEHSYRNQYTGQLYSDEKNIIDEALKPKSIKEPLDAYIQRVVPLLVMPTKSRNNRSVWVQPARKIICEKYEIQIGNAEGRERNDFIDEIAQAAFSDIIAQSFNRGLRRHFSATFYYERAPNESQEVRVGSRTFHYTIKPDANNNKKSDAANIKNDFLKSAMALKATGVSENEMVSLLTSQVGTFVSLFSCLLLSLSLKACFSVCILWSFIFNAQQDECPGIVRSRFFETHRRCVHSVQYK